MLGLPLSKDEIQPLMLEYIQGMEAELPNMIRHDDEFHEYGTSANELYEKLLMDMREWGWATINLNYVCHDKVDWSWKERPPYF